MATDHGVAPLLHKRLRQSGARASVPADVRERLRLAYLASAARNTRRYQELGPVLRCLRSSGIPVIVLKGAYLAEAVYGDVALRPMGDADLMIPRTELSKAQAVLLDMSGAHQQFVDIESHCRTGHQLPAVVIRGFTIEIHWAIVSPTEPFRVDAAGLWDRARPATIAGVEVLALSPEDLLLHLCLNCCYQDHLVGLKSLCGVAETIRRFRGEINWTEVAERAREWGAGRPVGLTLHLARSMLGTGVPNDVLERLVPGGLDQRMIETARQSVLAGTGYGPWVPFFQLRGVRSFGGKAKLSWKRVFLSRGQIAAMYPRSRESKHVWFYYARRLGYAIWSFGSHTLRRTWLTMRSRGRDRNLALFNWLKSGQP